MTLKIRYFFHRRNPRLPNQTGICPQIAGGDIIESFIKICLGPGTLLRKGISSKGCLPFWCNWAIQQSLPSSTCYTQNQRNIVPEMMPSFLKKHVWQVQSFQMLAINLVNHLRQLMTKQDQSLPSSWSRTNKKHLCQQKSFFLGSSAGIFPGCKPCHCLSIVLVVGLPTSRHWFDEIFGSMSPLLCRECNDLFRNT